MNNNYYESIPNNPLFQRLSQSNNINYPKYTNNFYENQFNVETLLSLNKGKKITIYQSYNKEDIKEFKGILESSGKDYIIISNPNNGKWNLLLNKYTSYIEFDENIRLSY